ncbi:MAG: dTMP kinase [Gammaproteobacteria bacterium]|nr:dTMP kinase [Gammaproteobacteria bacterium]
MTGRFITLEGVEGVGKTTNLEFIASTLRNSNIELIVSREPGGTDLGEQLRELLLHSRNSIDPTTELLLMAASRYQHIIEVIKPALARGHWVLSDRYTDASYAYQGGGRKLGEQVVARVHEAAGITLEPDLTLLLDMPASDGLQRASDRSSPDRIEQEALSFFDRAREAYLQRAKQNPTRIKVIDAAQSLKHVQTAIDTALQPLIHA